MAYENETVEQVLQIIKEKQDIVQNLISETEQQLKCFDDEVLNEKKYAKITARKDKYIKRIDQLSESFDGISSEAREEFETILHTNPPVAEEVHKQSLYLRKLTEQLQDIESKSKAEFVKYIGDERKKIKGKKLQRKTAAAYYKNMTKQMDSVSYFYDKKK